MDGLKVSDEALMVLNYTHVHELWESRFVAVGTSVRWLLYQSKYQDLHTFPALSFKLCSMLLVLGALVGIGDGRRHRNWKFSSACCFEITSP